MRIRFLITILLLVMSVSVYLERSAVSDIIGAMVRDVGSFIKPATEGDGFVTPDFYLAKLTFIMHSIAGLFCPILGYAKFSPMPRSAFIQGLKCSGP